MGTVLKPADETGQPAPVAPPTGLTSTVIVPGTPVAESGVTTTEFFATQIAALIMQGIALAALFHWIPNVPNGTDNLVFGISQSTVALVESGYAISRGIRKHGTTA